jgi:hypothetical protein
VRKSKKPAVWLLMGKFIKINNGEIEKQKLKTIKRQYWLLGNPAMDRSRCPSLQ